MQRVLFLFLFLIFLAGFFLAPVLSSKAPDLISDADDFFQGEEDAIKVWITAYSSSPDETDDTPNTTASQTRVRDGIVAANFLPFGTLIKIPEFFGDKIFVVEDRLHRRKKWVVDIWMPSKEEALEFGSYLTNIVVVQRPD